ncbi:MAG: choice-of-anchor L domain-containing protein [Bacteroidota bacterium]
MKKKITLVIFAILLGFAGAHAQITVTGGMTATQLANILCGSNLVVSNAVLTGSANASGKFTALNNNLGMLSGVVLSTGNVSTAPGPNSSPSTSQNLGVAGTAEMTALAGATSYDPIELRFDFTVQSDFIQFNYLFASEEYPEYAPPNNSYNDVFAFFISGPGIVGQENIALVPSTSLPVTIDNINAITNTQFYVNNLGGQDISFDAYTTMLTAQRTGLTPCATYTLRLVIADAGDAAYNSAVLLQENSLIQGTVDVGVNTINADDIALEGCTRASFTFSLDQPSTVDKTVNYTIAGTATNGIDYSHIANSLTIPAGQTSATVYIEAISDGVPEGQETVYIIYKPEVCAPYDTAKLYIDDAQPIVYTLSQVNLGCYDNSSGQIIVNASGGFPPYTYEVKDATGTITNYTANPITGLDAGTYVVYVMDSYGCKAEALVVGGLFNADTTFLPDGSGVTYTTTIPISGFDAGETLTSLTMLQNICLNMEHSYMGDLEMRLQSPGGQSCILKEAYGGGSCDLGEPIATGPIDGSAGSLLTDPGTGYDYCFNSAPFYGTMSGTSNLFYRNYTDGQGHTYSDYYLPAGSYVSYQPLSQLLGSPLNGNWTMYVTDHMYLDNGYIFNWTISFIGDLPDTIITLTQPAPINVSSNATNATCGTSNGAINLSVSGSYPPFTFLWSNSATTEDITGLAAGSYTVTVSDAHSCTFIDTYLISNTGSMDAIATITPVTCSGGSTGAIAIAPSGGTSPYTYQWSNGPTTQNISSLAAGAYTLTMTDQNSCVIIRPFIVTSNPAIVISAPVLQDEECGTHNGAITASATGGSGSFGYQWSNGATTAAITGLSAGSYIVTVTDAYSCTATHTYTLTNDVTNCGQYCYLDAVAISITDDQCGHGTGAINLDVTDATQPYIVQWSNSATTEDISGLVQGTYTVTVTDANQCVKVKSFVVGNNTGTLTISDFAVVNEACGNDNGLIDITVNGGALPYTYHWSNNAATQDVSGLAAGTYSVSITDANNCVYTATYTVVNNAGTITATASITHELCNQHNGSIIQTVSGGYGTLTYHWNTGSVQQNLNSLSDGTYTCTITDGGGCQLIKIYVVNSLAGALSVSNIAVTNEMCTNGLGAIDLTVTGPAPVYAWSNSATTEDLSGLSAGTYSCTVTNQQGCMVTTGPIYVFDAPGTLSVTTDHIIDEVCGNANGSVTVNVAGGTTPYTFLWSNGHISEDIYSLHAGNFTLTVTDANGCKFIYDATVNNTPGTLEIQNAVVTNETCGNANGAVTLTVTGGTTPYTYAWSNGPVTQNITALHAGSYTVTVTSANGCVQSTTATVLNIAHNMDPTWQITNEVCTNGQGAIDLTVTGGTLPLTYLWSNSATTQDLANLSAGNYSCTVTDATSCKIFIGPIAVGNHATTLNATTVVTNETCGNDLGEINLIPTGGTLPLTYLWSNSATTQDLTGLSAGMYSYTVTDANTCKVFGQAVVINNPSGNLAVTMLVTDEQCNNASGAINLTITGGTTPITYLWTGGATTEDRTALASGNYSCTITDNAGCVLPTGQITVGDNPGTLEIVSMVVTDATCSTINGKINLTVSGGTTPYTFNWSNGLHTEDLTALAPGNYTITVIDANGCNVSGSVAVNSSNGSFSISAAVVTNEHCSGNDGAVNITVIGGTTPYTYSWSTGATTQDVSALTAGTYSVYLHDNSGCATNASYNVINEGEGFGVANAAITHDVCGSGSGAINITLNGGSSPFLYTWSNSSSTEDIASLTAGNYTITITDDNGCNTIETYSVNNTPGTMSALINSSNEYCGNGLGSVTLTMSGGALPYNYTWNNGSTIEDLYNLHAGIYTVTFTDHVGCEGVRTDTVFNITNGFAANVATVTQETCGNANGAVNINVSGGTTPYTFIWSNAAVTEDLTNVAAGNYTVTVTDFAGCSFTLNSTVTNNTGTLAVSFNNVVNESCGDGEGFINIEISGGVSPYTYLWSNSATTQDIIGIHGGSYTVTITDNAGCKLIKTYTVLNENDNGLQANGSVTDAICSGANGSVDLSVSGGVSPFTYTWSNSTSLQDINGVLPGIYTVTVTDNLGCSSYGSFSVGQQQNPNLAFSTVYVMNDYCFNNNGQIYFEATGGTSYTYYFEGALVPSNDVTGLSAGFYEFSIMDGYGCVIDSSATVGNFAPFTVNPTNTDETCGGNNGTIDIAVSSGNPTYSWSNGATTQNLTGLSAGTYTCTVTDGACSQTITVTIDDVYDFTLSSGVTADFCADTTGAIDLTPAGAGPFTFLWSNGETTEDLVDLISGWYHCTVTNTGSGCIQVIDILVPSSSSGVAVNNTILPDTCGQGLGSVVNNIFGGSGNYSFSWGHGPVDMNLDSLAAGDYTFTVIDNTDGCSYVAYITVPNINAFTITSTGIVDASCATCADGSVNLTVVVNPALTGEVMSYNWSNSTTNEDLLNVVPGTYTVTVSSSSGCDTVMTFVVNFYTSAITMPTDAAVMNVFPNPASDQVTIDFRLPGTDNATIMIYDYNQKLVYNAALTAEGKHVINSSGFAQGVYHVLLTSDKHNLHKKLVIVR